MNPAHEACADNGCFQGLHEGLRGKESDFQGSTAWQTTGNLWVEVKDLIVQTGGLD